VAGGALVLLATVSIAQGQATGPSEPIKARQRISMMEGVLERAVANGADNLVRQVRAFFPDPPMFLGVPKARGFRLEGYGVFFDVEIPGLRPPVTWTLRYMLNDTRRTTAALAELRGLMGQLSPRDRERAQEMVARLEAQIGGNAAQGQPGGVLRSSGPVSGEGRDEDPGVVADPNHAYTIEVKSALIEAMLESSGPLALADDEWLTVAARDNVEGVPLSPAGTSDFATLIFRIKGGDLAAFRAGRLTVDQARGRVELRAY
jgi:hypothetical protein